LARPSRALVRTTAVLVVLLLLLGGLTFAASTFADQLTAPPTVRPFEPDSTIVAADDTTVTLPAEGFAGQPGRWGLQLPQQRHAVMGEEVARDDDTVTRTWDDFVGIAPQAGEPVRVDEFVWVGTPSARDLPFEDVTVDGPLGPMDAWWVPADGEPVGTVVFVHGRGGTREEALRFLPAMVDAGWDVLVQTYRGDAGAPGWPDGRVRYGSTEWADVDAAVTYTADRVGEERPLVLFGVSMGGALVAQHLDRAPSAALVDGVVLDSPLLSMDALLDLQAGLNGVPSWAEPVLLGPVQWVADLRYGLDAGALEQTDADATFSDLPVLLFHGDADGFVPAEPSAAFAANHPQVQYERVPDAGHVRSWNLDPPRYDAELVAFLDQLA